MAFLRKKPSATQRSITRLLSPPPFFHGVKDLRISVELPGVFLVAWMTSSLIGTRPLDPSFESNFKAALNLPETSIRSLKRFVTDSAFLIVDCSSLVSIAPHSRVSSSKSPFIHRFNLCSKHLTWSLAFGDLKGFCSKSAGITNNDFKAILAKFDLLFHSLSRVDSSTNFGMLKIL